MQCRDSITQIRIDVSLDQAEAQKRSERLVHVFPRSRAVRVSVCGAETLDRGHIQSAEKGLCLPNLQVLPEAVAVEALVSNALRIAGFLFSGKALIPRPEFVSGFQARGRGLLMR